MSTFHATVSLALLLSSNDHAASHSSVLDRTVMAWVEGKSGAGTLHFPNVVNTRRYA